MTINLYVRLQEDIIQYQSKTSNCSIATVELYGGYNIIITILNGTEKASHFSEVFKSQTP